jgi:beta-glucanase (GH16 family)
LTREVASYFFTLINAYYFAEKYGYCTQADNWGCDRSAVNGHILNPVLSGKVTTKAAIRYGKVNVRAMIPKGDWIWPGNYED